jgi:hypothetical protein
MTVKELKSKLESCPDGALVVTGEPAAQDAVELMKVVGDGPDYVVIRSTITAPPEWETPARLAEAERSAVL